MVSEMLAGDDELSLCAFFYSECLRHDSSTEKKQRKQSSSPEVIPFVSVQVIGRRERQLFRSLYTTRGEELRE